MMDEPGRWEFFVDTRDYMMKRSLFVAKDTLSGNRSFASISMVEFPAGDEPEATLVEQGRGRGGDVTGFLQAALEAAWSLGLRPRDQANTSDELKAVRYHLEDMRSLVLKPAAAAA